MVLLLKGLKGGTVNNLLAAGSWALDVAFFVILFVGIFIGVMRGFVAGICKLAGKIFSVAVAVVFCVSFSETLEGWFGTTTALNHAIGGKLPFGQWIMVALCFIALFLIVYFGAKLVGAVGTSLVNKFAPCRIINRVLGGLLGGFKALILIFALLAICLWIPSESMHAFISSSGVVGKIFASDWFQNSFNFGALFQRVVKEVGDINPQAWIA